jgi:hypothetical protein
MIKLTALENKSSSPQITALCHIIRTDCTHTFPSAYLPCCVEHKYVSETSSDPVAVPEVIPPKGAHKAREDEAHEQRKPGI